MSFFKEKKQRGIMAGIGKRGGRPKGLPKTGGIKKGYTDETVKQLRNLVADIVRKNVETIDEDLRAMSPRYRVALLEKLLNYCLPRMQAVESTITAEVQTQSRLDLSGISDADMSEIADKIRAASEKAKNED